MNVVVIPCFNRAEFLGVTLQRILKAQRANEFIYLFSLDDGYDPECLKVINEFPLEKVIVKRKHTNYGLGKQSFNLLSAYAEACYLSEKYVILIEDDIFIHNDFFNWTLGVHSEKNTFCSIGTHNHNTSFNTTEDDSAYYFGTRTDYQSWGVGWDKEILEEHILKHANVAYFTKPMQYLKTVFKQEWIGKHFAEQDGLIRRVRYTLPDMKVIFPHVPRAFHGGFYSYHRNEYKHLTGTLEERMNKVIEITSNEELYKSHCESIDFYNDSRAINLDKQYNYNKLNLVQIEAS